jgi:hypothetical protein
MNLTSSMNSNPLAKRQQPMRRKMNRFRGYDGDSGSGRLGGSPLAVEKTKITTKLFLVLNPRN